MCVRGMGQDYPPFPTLVWRNLPEGRIPKGHEQYMKSTRRQDSQRSWTVNEHWVSHLGPDQELHLFQLSVWMWLKVGVKSTGLTISPSPYSSSKWKPVETSMMIQVSPSSNTWSFRYRGFLSGQVNLWTYWENLTEPLDIRHCPVTSNEVIFPCQREENHAWDIVCDDVFRTYPGSRIRVSDREGTI